MALTGQLGRPFRLQLRGLSGYEDDYGSSPERQMTTVEVCFDWLEYAPRQIEMPADAQASVASESSLRKMS
jgi:hypothetical protein